MQRVLPFIWFMIWVTPLQASDSENPRYTTSAECQSCHQAQYKDWSNSHHSWAWREPSKKNVLGDFNNAEFEHAGFTYRFITEGEVYYVVADNASGESTRYKVHSVVGVTPLQQYLVQTEKGRLQALDVAWDTDKKRWYHLYPDEDTSATNGLHWSRSYKNWNSRCAECHATDYRKNYDPRQGRYASAQAEIGVGCEACHGPGEAHVNWAHQPEEFKSTTWQDVDKLGLVSTYQAENPSSQINLCAGCHSRREPLGSNSPVPGAEFDDHYRLSLLRENLYFPDGQIKEEVYVYGSFLQSRMHARGVQCTHCHDPHSYQIKLSGNSICTQCHNKKGHPNFPTLTKSDYDASSHHFHIPSTEGSMCVDCHMPSRDYMVIDGRRDHGFRVPRPDLAEVIGAPDPCIGCHQDKDSKWAMESIRQHHPRNRISQPHFSQVFAAIGANKTISSVEDLINIAADTEQPNIVRATAIERCASLPHGLTDIEIGNFTRDESALVRMTAIGLSRGLSTDKKLPLLLPLFSDNRQSVRIEAAKAMIGIESSHLDGNGKKALQTAMREFQQSMLAKSDFPEGQLVLGGVALTLKRFDAASQAFQRAVDMDPQRIEAWSILIRLTAALGQTNKARTLFLTALQSNPDNVEIQQLGNSLGLRLGVPQ